MSGWQPSRPPWETQGQPLYTPDDTWYGSPQGPRVVIKPHAQPGRGGSRPGRYAEPQREANRTTALVGVVAGLAASVGIAVGAVQLTYVTWGETPAPPAPAAAAATPAPAPTPTPSASKSGAGAAETTAYALGTPATAGGYALTTPMSSAIQAVGSAGASQLMTAIKAAGGKSAGNVSGEYFISGNQALGYAGYTGTFSPAAALSAFQAGASNVTTEPAGPHGGELACGEVTASGTAVPGTACVWATTTTVGMVEFFAGGSLETVPHAKAASDTLKFRDGVEALKGAAAPSASVGPSATGTSRPTASTTPSA